MTSPLLDVARMFKQARVPYVLIGAHAINAWIEPRITADIDVTAHVDSDALPRLERILAAEGYRMDHVHGGDLPSGPDFVRWISSDGVIVLELQAAKTAFQHEVIRRAMETAEGVRVATPEDLIVLKLIANRPKDRIDLLGLLALPDLDRSYIERWADEWQVLDLLQDLLRSR